MTASEHTELLPRIRQWHWDARGPGMVEHPNGAYVLVSDVQALLAARALPDGAEPTFDDQPYAGPFTGPLSPGQPIRWQVKCSNIPDEWFTDEGSADRWANSPGHYDAEIVVWSASPDGAEPVPAADVLRFIKDTILLMQESGSWDPATMQRVVENIGGLIDQAIPLFASPTGMGVTEE